MFATRQAKRALKRLLLGPNDFAQPVTIGLPERQGEVAVLLKGAGAERDVTDCHFMACGAPFLIGIPENHQDSHRNQAEHKLSLVFQEQRGRSRVLGRIELRYSASVPFGEESLLLFRSGGSQNYCLPLPRLWARYLQYAYHRRRSPNSEVAMSARDVHSMCVFYICPRPTGLVTVSDGVAVNVFPMNLMGTPSNKYFCFALKTATPVVPLVTRAGRVALSSVPAEQAPVAYSLGKNHNRESIDLTQFPFTLRCSELWKLPVPAFALRVRELQVESAHNLGSHTLFIARVMHDEKRAAGTEFFLIHGMYAAWRQEAKQG